MKGINRLLNQDFMEYGNVIINSRYYPNNWLPYGTISGDTSLGLVITTTMAYTFDRCFEMYKVGSNNTGMSQTINFGYDIAGLDFDIGMWIRIHTQTGDSGIKLSYKWLDSSGTIIGSQVTIDSLTATQNYTLSSVSAVTAPTNAQRIWLGVETIGSDQPMLAYVDSPYIYGGKTYGLKIYDTSGDSSIILPEASSIIASGTVTMPNILQDDGTYGVDIDLPGDDYIDMDRIGVMVQARDFDWKAIVNILEYDTGNKFWGNFFGDSGISIPYYEKAPDGVMTEWEAGAMTPGTQATYNRLINVSPFTGWETFTTSVKKVRLFAGIDYTFLKTAAGGTGTYTLYGRDYGISTLADVGYMLGTEQGDVERYYEYVSLVDFPLCLWGPHSKFDISIIHANGSETSLDTDVAAVDVAQTYAAVADKESSYNATWACPGYGAWVSSDRLKFVLKVNGTFSSAWLSTYNWSFSRTFITPQLNWTSLEATTWTLYRYIWFHRDGISGYGRVRTYWGATKEMKATNISADYAGSAAQQVFSIGDDGISEVDYMIYLKDYDGS